MTKIVNLTLPFRLFRFIFFLFLVFVLQNRLNAQTKNTDVVGISGVLMSADSLHTIPDAQIFSRDNYLGSFSDTIGRFYITVARNDSVMLVSLGYTTRIIPITDSILQLKQPITFYMALDTVLIHEIIIHAFWDYETFKQLLIHMKPAQSSYDISEDLDKRPLLYRARQGGFSLFSPIQSLYNLLNQKAVIQRRLLHNRRMYNRRMIKLGRPQDTIPSTLDYMRDKIRQ
ncbi:MAG: hypothetical protein IEMM0006_1035 [bacterium]|nr:MAG: hypothetical protein IEMM0006_1035 [bacterium]